ncbi:MAG: NADH-quinone oxidoreductase subunit L, partial [Ignavibacteria bacterium]
MVKFFYLITLLPLTGFIINGVFGYKIKNEKTIGLIGSTTIFGSFLISILTFFHLLSLEPASRSITVHLFSWITSGSLNISIAYLIDPLSVVMCLIITGVGFLIHVYSIGYMRSDKGFARFFSFMNLFIFAMLNLVLADNFLLMFIGWEGVGLCSYLLIGFWYEKKFTGDAANKAFWVNRIGDIGFIIAIFFIFVNFNSLNFQSIFSSLSATSVNTSVITLITILLFIGATGKSAQIPLFVWLPDAMAGPTPVSALIHAATMVTAGVYLVARCSIMFALSPFTMDLILLIGAFTAFLSATIAVKQNDIKKILAYSTVSQLGFMFMALGAGAFSTAIFHLTTHAYFKALMFLAAGSVIHSMHREQDITKMGGLKNKMKITFLTFLIGGIAISGIPPLSGFFSKDEILSKVFISSNYFIFGLGLLTAFMTAFYIFRLISLTFYGSPRYDEKQLYPHESPKVMTVPLQILAVLSIIGGLIG